MNANKLETETVVAFFKTMSMLYIQLVSVTVGATSRDGSVSSKLIRFLAASAPFEHRKIPTQYLKRYSNLGWSGIQKGWFVCGDAKWARTYSSRTYLSMFYAHCVSYIQHTLFLSLGQCCQILHYCFCLNKDILSKRSARRSNISRPIFKGQSLYEYVFDLADVFVSKVRTITRKKH
jgi:hypothetical protein